MLVLSIMFLGIVPVHSGPGKGKKEMEWIRWFSIVLVMSYGLGSLYSLVHAAEATDVDTWKTYTNTRFGFSVRYPPDWRPGNPMPDGTGITFSPPIDDTQVSLFGFMNVIEGNSPDGRQTLDQFVMAHRRIITELFEKKHIKVSWETDRPTKLGGFDAKQLTFTYRNTNTEMREIHIMSVGRNEGRGVRIKIPVSDTGTMIPLVTKLLETYQPGRDQNAVSPFAPSRGDQPSAPLR
ncbi:MAG: hypothetical protein HXY51_00400 [Nitrospirae bacterium]|nr:hypothetical protein [Nitrospirota bacterium]